MSEYGICKRERFLIELMTWDRKLKVSKESSCKTVKARFWPGLLGKSPCNLSSCPLFAVEVVPRAPRVPPRPVVPPVPAKVAGVELS